MHGTCIISIHACTCMVHVPLCSCQHQEVSEWPSWICLQSTWITEAKSELDIIRILILSILCKEEQHKNNTRMVAVKEQKDKFKDTVHSGLYLGCPHLKARL